MIGILLSASLVAADSPPGIDPASVVELVFPGESVDVDKTVHTPEIPPKPDIYFLADTTGSMTPVINQVKTDAASILTDLDAATSDPRYGAGDYKDFPYDGYAFSNAAPIPATDDDGTAALAAIAGWFATGGYDGSEGQFYALDQIAEGVVNWRADSTKIVVWFGDAPAHDPVCSAISGLGYDIDEASLIAKLVANEIRVVAISTLSGFYGDGLDDDPTYSASDYTGFCAINGTSGQATRIAAATGGVHLTDVAPEDISDAILEGLSNLPAEVELESNCTAPISTSFTPPMVTVTSGDDAFFAETIMVEAGAAGGTYFCEDYALINGVPMTDESGATIFEEKTIHVPGIELLPETATNELLPGASHTVTATVTAGGYGPVAGVRVEFEVISGPNMGESGEGVTDVLGEVTFTYDAVQGPAGLGTDTIVATFTDADDTKDYGSDQATKEWVDTTPPDSFCDPTVNPAGKSEPKAPGKGGQGQNQDGFYILTASDLVWEDGDLAIFVTDDGSGAVFGPFPVGTRIKYTEANGATPSIKPMGGNNGNGGGQANAVDVHIIGNGDALVTAVDGSGNVSSAAACLVPPPPD